MEHYPAPDAALLCMLCDMRRLTRRHPATAQGFDRREAGRALSRTFNHNAEAAINWIVEHPDDVAESPRTALPSGGTPSSTDCKMVLVVPLDVPMSAGKLAAQSAHAAVGLYKRLLGCAPVWLPHWEAGGERTVVLQVGSSREMHDMRMAATAAALPCHVVADAGRTEVEPGTETVLAIAGPTREVDIITGHLHTLRSTCTTCTAAEAS